MSNIDKRALREAAEKALPAMKRLLMMPNDELFDEALLNVDGDVDAANAFNLLTGPETVLALLDELEAAEKRIAELEARTVTLPENITSANAPEVFEISSEAERLGLRGTYASYAVGWNARGMADKEALRAASICIDGES